MLTLAQAIRQKVDDTNGADKAWLLDFDSQGGQFDGANSFLPADADQGSSGEVVLLFDWAQDSQHASPGWVEGAGDALFAMLADMGFVDPQAGTGAELHFIGQGTGAVVTSEAVERLAYYNVPVDQVTYLDPHDFDQGMVTDTAQQLSVQAQPSQYGAAVWDNVAFADVYYQTRGRNGASVTDSVVPQGRPIPGAFNFLVDTTNFLPTGNYDDLNVFGDDQYLWEGFYLSTVNGEQPQDNESSLLTGDTPAPALPIPVDTLGYAFSSTKATIARPAATFFDQLAAPQDHTHSPAYVVDAAGQPNFAGLLAHRQTDTTITAGTQRPQWDPLAIVNGDFEQVGDLIGFSQRGVPGWTNHASVPLFDVQDMRIDLAGKFVQLDAQQPGITHNAVYVPPEAEWLAADVKVALFSGNDRFQVLLDDTVLAEELPATDDIDMTFIDAAFETHRFAIPEELRGGAHNITIRLADGGDNAFNAAVQVDNLRFEGYLFEVRAGDVTKVDLRQLLDAESQALLPTFSMISGVQDAGQIVLPEDLDPPEPSFASTGQFYFIPDFNTDGITLQFDDDDAVTNNDDFATLFFEVTVGAETIGKTARVRIADGYSQTGENSIVLTGSVGNVGDNHDIDEYRVQQRLRYFNFRGQNNADVEVDGDAGTITQQAIRLFQAATQEDGLGAPSNNTFFVDGRVDIGFRTQRWLNSPVAPYWSDSREPYTAQLSFKTKGRDQAGRVWR